MCLNASAVASYITGKFDSDSEFVNLPVPVISSFQLQVEVLVLSARRFKVWPLLVVPRAGGPVPVPTGKQSEQEQQKQQHTEMETKSFFSQQLPKKPKRSFRTRYQHYSVSYIVDTHALYTPLAVLKRRRCRWT